MLYLANLQFLAGQRAVFNPGTIEIRKHFALVPIQCPCRRGINRDRVFVAGEARAVHLCFVVAGKEARGLSGRCHSNRFEIVLEEGSRMIAVELAGRHCALTHLEKCTVERTCGPHRPGAVEDGATTFQERIKGDGVIVILPALERRKAEWFDTCIAKIQGRCRIAGSCDQPEAETNDTGGAKNDPLHAVTARLQWQEASSSDRAR